MKHMNPKITRLLHEGFSISTLEKMNSNQINLLFEKVKKSKRETKEAQMLLNPKDPKDMQIAKEKGMMDGQGNLITKVEGEMSEKAVSKKQQQYFGIVRGMQKGDIPKKGNAGKTADDLDKKEVKKFASTEHKGLPTRKKKKENNKGEKSEVKKIEENIMNLVEKHLHPELSKKEILSFLNKK